MSITPSLVVSRYLKKAAFSLVSDDRFRPPAAIVSAVERSELPPEVLNVWKYVVGRMGDHFNYGAALKHWRNKCNKMGGALTLPQKFVEGLGGEGAEGAFSVKTGEQIEDWVKETLKSKGLIAEVGNSAHDWELEIGHFEREVAEAQDKIDLHLRVLAQGKDDAGRTLKEKGIAQRQKWLEEAKSTLDANQKELDKCKAALDELRATMARYDEHKSPTIEFEKEFQFMLLLAAKDFDQKTILEAVGKAVKRFQEGLDIPDTRVQPDMSRYTGYKEAGLLDFLSGALAKAWEFLKSAWAGFTDWISDIKKDTAKLDALLTKAGAPK